MMNDLDRLLHPLGGELEQGDEVSQLHDGGVVALLVEGVLEPETRGPSPTQNSTQKWSLDMKKKRL